MRIAVLKFGGTSVATLEHILRIGAIVDLYQRHGFTPIVVVSAMAGITNQLISYTQSINLVTPSAEHDLVLSTGEQVTAGLLALSLNQRGIAARSYLAHQIPIKTNSTYMNAQILDIPKENLLLTLQNNTIPIIAGYQGVDTLGRITTLGRGGSDTSAVALACVLKADLCHIYTDVDGVYSADPNLIEGAHHYLEVSLQEMIKMAYAGAKVLHHRSIELALHNNLDIRVLSSLKLPEAKNFGTDFKGTLLTDKNRLSLEAPKVRAVVLRSDEIRLEFRCAHVDFVQFWGCLENFSSFYQIHAHNNNSTDCYTGYLLYPINRHPELTPILAQISRDIPSLTVKTNHSICRITIIGTGLGQVNAGAISVDTAFKEDIILEDIIHEDLSITILLDKNKGLSFTQKLHSIFITESLL